MRKAYTSVPTSIAHPGSEGKDVAWIPMLNTKVMFQQQITPFWIKAVVDSGSSHCVFKAEVADFLHIDLSNAPRGDMHCIVPGVLEPVFYCRVQLVIEGNWTIHVLAGFAKKLNAPAILGRSGFFDAFRVSFDHSTSPPELEIDRILPVQ